MKFRFSIKKAVYLNPAKSPILVITANATPALALFLEPAASLPQI